MPQVEPIPIQSAPVGSTVVVVSVDGGTKDSVGGSAARRAIELGLVVGAVCRIIRKAPFGGPLEIEIGRTSIGIRPAADLRVFVRLHNGGARETAHALATVDALTA